MRLEEVTAKDLMGNTIEQAGIDVDSTPLYLVAPNSNLLAETLRTAGE